MNSALGHSPFTIHHSRLPGFLLGGLMITIIMLLTSPAAAQEPAPLVVDADEVTYDEATQIGEARGNVRLTYKGIRLLADHVVFDLRQERLVATGHVVLIDAQGRELRGERLTYDVRTEQAEITRTETVIDRVHIRSERLETKDRQIIAHDATVTTCDPDRPAYRITATRVEVIPGDRLTATGASLWLGRYRLFTLPVITVSLRSPEEIARSLPRLGYNNIDGFWIDYPYRYFLGSLRGSLYSKYGARTGLIVNNTLSYSTPGYTLALAVGRSQNVDLKIFDLAELTLAFPARRFGVLPVLFDLSIGGGWFRESLPDISTSRLQYRVGLSSLPIPLGPRTSWQTAASWQDAYYGNGAHHGILRVNSALVHQLSAASSLSLAYRVVNVSGATPFVFDAIKPEDIYHDLALQYSLTGRRGASLETRFGAGAIFYFSHRYFPSQSISVNAGYGERVPDRYHWWFSGEFNVTSRAWKLSTDSGLSVGRGTYFTVQAIYNTIIKNFEDLDYILTSRLCDCIDLSLKYRQMRREIWFEVGLSAFPGGRLQFSPTVPP